MEFSGLDLHPFVKEQSGTYQLLPPQTVALSDKIGKNGKVTKWGKANMDALATTAKLQYAAKSSIVINYQLVNGDFVASEFAQHVKDRNEFDLLVEVSADLEIPSYARHYDIISQPFNTLLGELSELPDLFMVSAKGEMAESDKLKAKKQLLIEWFNTSVKREVLSDLLKKGIDPDDPTAIKDEEQMAMLQQEMEALEKKHTPPEIEQKMRSTYRHIVEQWGQKEFDDQVVRFNLKKMQKVEFADYLTVGQRYREIYQDAFGLKVRSLNPRYVFSHKSPETEYVQDGDCSGYIEFLSIAALVEKYGYLMTKKQLDDLQKPWKDLYANTRLGRAADGKKLDYVHPSGMPYQTMSTTNNYLFEKTAPWMGKVGINSPFLDEIQLEQISGSSARPALSSMGMVMVIKGYWMSQKRVSKLYWINPATKLEEKILVDESFAIPKYIKEVQGSVLFSQEDELNTITHTYVNEGWQGIKVEDYYNNSGTHFKPMYLGIKPNELQFKGELYVYSAKLPICGQYANNRNTRITSFVDKLRNLQFFYNILMNQCFHFFQTEVLPFMLIDINTVPKAKGWAGEDSMQKWINIAQRLGYTFADTSPMNTQGANSGGQLPREIDLDRGKRVLARLEVANVIRQLALQQVGISDQRLGDIGRSETATGVNTSISRSYTQTAPIFESFFECEREILQMQLDAAQYLQSKKLDLGNLLINSSFTNNLLEINANDFNNYQLHIYVHKSQAEKRKLDFAQRMAIENNTTPTPMSERILMGTTNNLNELTDILRVNEEKYLKMEEDRNRMAQQANSDSVAQAEKQRQEEKEQFYAKLQNELDIATMQALGIAKGQADDNNNGLSDIIEFYKERREGAKLEHQIGMDTAKQNLAQQSLYDQRNMKQAEMDLKREEMKNEQLLMDKSLAKAKTLGDKSK